MQMNRSRPKTGNWFQVIICAVLSTALAGLYYPAMAQSSKVLVHLKTSPREDVSEAEGDLQDIAGRLNFYLEYNNSGLQMKILREDPFPRTQRLGEELKKYGANSYVLLDLTGPRGPNYAIGWKISKVNSAGQLETIEAGHKLVNAEGVKESEGELQDCVRSILNSVPAEKINRTPARRGTYMVFWMRRF